jgi:glycosyltransferase involved in cell wall biosynthesis
MAGYLRKQDYKAAQKVDYFIANSQHIADDIKTFYGRESEVIHPPVDISRFSSVERVKQLEEHFVMWGRHVPYKRFDIAIEACNRLKKKLVIIGDGPDTERLRKLAGSTVKVIGRVSDEELNEIASTATAFIAPMEEDFGIAPVEAMASGLPVIAYKAGGAMDYVIEGKSGVFFEEQTVDSLVAVLQDFQSSKFKEKVVRAKAGEFSKEIFKEKIEKFVASKQEGIDK